jgi:hypothetical protein
MTPETQEDRRHEDWLTTALVARVFRNGRPTTYPLLELSRTGARLATPVGDELPMVFWVELDLPGELPVRVRARTMWCDGPTSGIRFVDVEELEGFLLSESLDALARA